MCGIKNMAQINLSTELKRTHRRGEQTCGCQGGERESVIDLEIGVNRSNYYLWNG